MSASLGLLDGDIRNSRENASEEEEEDGFFTPPEYPEALEDGEVLLAQQGKTVLNLKAIEDAVELLKPSLEAFPANRTGRKIISNEPDNAVNEIVKDLPATPHTGSDRSEKGLALLKERARALASRSDFYEACSLLEKAEESQEIRELGIKFLMAECYIQLGREKKANRCLDYVQNSLTSRPHLDIDDLEELVADLVEQHSYLRATVILKIIAEIVLSSTQSPDEKLSGVYRCFDKLDDILTAMLNQNNGNRTVEVDMGFETMSEIYEKICAIQDCDRDQQVLKEAWCCRHMDYNYSLLDDRRKCIQIATRAIRSLEDHFTEAGAQRYRLYGWLLHNLGVTLCNSRRFEESLAAHKRALEAKENAIDHEDEDSKKEDIDETKKSIKKVRSAMGRI